MIDILIFSIKPFFIFCNSLFIFRKLCRIRTTKKDLLDIPISLLFAIIAGFVSYLYVGLSILVIGILLNLYTFIKSKQSHFVSTTICVISLAIAYLMFEISCFISSPISMIVYFLHIEYRIKTAIMQFIIGMMVILFIFILFKKNKIKNALYPNIQKTSYQILTMISFAYLVVVSFFNSQFYQDELATLTLLFSLIICLFLLFFWFKHINSTYKNHVINRNIEILENSIDELEKENLVLKEQNVKLAEIIHRDNKILPALREAVATLIDSKQSKSIIALESHLIDLSEERNELIADYKGTFTSLPTTGNLSVDAAIKFLNTKAQKENATFLFHTDGNVESICNKIPLTELVGLICDLGENAIISTRESASKKIYVSLVSSEESSCIEFYDSGEEFSAKALEFFGKRRYTTHKSTGGSGIGLMSIYALMEKYKFSFELNETNVYPYSKAIKITFDNCKQILIKTNRQEIINLALEREDFIIINE